MRVTWNVTREIDMISAVNALVLSHITLPGQMARQIMQQFPRHVCCDDIESEGYMGLIDAARRYDAATRVPFSAYARTRIRGAILDYLRREDPRSRRQARKEKASGNVTRTVPLGATVWDHHSKEYVECSPTDPRPTPEAEVISEQQASAIHQLAHALLSVIPNKRNREVIVRRYFHGQTHYEIAAAMGFHATYSASIHTKTIAMLGRKVLQGRGIV